MELKIKSLVLNAKRYFIAIAMFIALSTVLLLLTNKSESFIALNSYHFFWLNVFFINFTFIGDGIFAVCLIAFIFFYRKNKQQATVLCYSFLSSGLIAQLIKNLIHAPRPKLFFESGQYLFFIDGVTHANYASFPSGHTATAFAMATVFAMVTENKKGQLCLLCLALLVGYSRIYLAQHFLIDVIAGAIIGTLSAVFSFYMVSNTKNIKRFLKKKYALPNSNNAPFPSNVQHNI